MDGEGTKYPPLTHPKQLPGFEDVDLSVTRDPVTNCKTGVLSNGHAARPAQLMRDMGFDPDANITPLQFLTAVVNDDIDLLFKHGVKGNRLKAKGGLGISYRLKAAEVAAKYFHEAVPSLKVTANADAEYSKALVDALMRGNARVEMRPVLLQQINNISADVPLARASYPPALQEVIEAQIQEEDGDYEHPTY